MGGINSPGNSLTSLDTAILDLRLAFRANQTGKGPTSHIDESKGPLDCVLRLIHNAGGSGDMLEVAREVYRRELLKGSTETLLLSLLANESMYGYQLVKEMDKRSSGYFRFKEGTLYPALHRLERDGFIEGTWETSPSGQNRRYYHITAKGCSRLATMLEEWNLFTKAVNLVAQPDGVQTLPST